MHNHPQFESRFFITKHGLKLHYRYHQNSSDKVCVFLHGFMNDSAIFLPLMQKLAEDFNLIALDFRGHGDSDWDEEERYLHQDLITDLDEFLSQFSFTTWHLIGHSLGARVALLHEAQYRQHPASITLIDTGPVTNAAGSEKVRRDAENMPTLFPSFKDYFTFLRAQYFLADTQRLKEWSQYGLKPYGNQFKIKTDPKFTQALWKKNQQNKMTLTAPYEDEIWQALKKLKCPTLIIRGQASAILSQSIAEKMTAQLNNGVLKTIPRAGHAVILDNPIEIEKTISLFINN